MTEVHERAAVYEEAGGQIVYRASSLGGCVGMLARCRAGLTPAPPPDLMLERYAEGHAAEYEVIAAGLGVDWREVTGSELARYGQVVRDPATGSEQVEVELAWSNKVIRCHPDGIAAHRGVKPPELAPHHVLEAKFLGPEMHDTVTRDVKKLGLAGLPGFYRWQTSVEMLATGLPLLLILGRKKVDAREGVREVTLDGPPDVYEFVAPHYTLKDVKARVAEVEGAARRAERGDGWPKCPLPLMYPCGFFADHDEPESDEIDDAVLRDLVLAYGLAKSLEAQYGAEADGVKGDITDRLIELKEDGGMCGGWQMVFREARQGNVSWAGAYKALSKQTGERVDEDEYRGKAVAGGLTMKQVDD